MVSALMCNKCHGKYIQVKSSQVKLLKVKSSKTLFGNFSVTSQKCYKHFCKYLLVCSTLKNLGNQKISFSFFLENLLLCVNSIALKFWRIKKMYCNSELCQVKSI